MSYDALRGFGGYDQLRGLGDTTRFFPETITSVHQFEVEIDKVLADALSAANAVKAAVVKKNEDDLICTGYRWHPIGLAYNPCEEKVKQANDLVTEIMGLKSIIMEPGNAPGDAPGVPVLFTRPKDALDYIKSISSTIKSQGKSLAKWADKPSLEAGFDAFTDGLSTVLAAAADYAGRVGGATVKKTIEKGAKDVSKGKFPYFTVMMVGGAVVGTVIVVSKIRGIFK